MEKSKRIRTLSKVQFRARELRQEMTTAEAKLWERLRNRQMGGFKFRRQHPLGAFIADFYCASCRLVIEIDGEVHESQKEQDEFRTYQFEQFGYRVIRFNNREVEQNINHVLEVILNNCQQHST
jgi:very-short-patch-repair endonuclease